MIKTILRALRKKPRVTIPDHERGAQRLPQITIDGILSRDIDAPTEYEGRLAVAVLGLTPLTTVMFRRPCQGTLEVRGLYFKDGRTRAHVSTHSTEQSVQSPYPYEPDPERLAERINRSIEK